MFIPATKEAENLGVCSRDHLHVSEGKKNREKMRLSRLGEREPLLMTEKEGERENGHQQICVSSRSPHPLPCFLCSISLRVHGSLSPSAS